MVENKIETEGKLSPEGLTPAQEKLAGMLFDAKTIAPVGRRRKLSDGTYELYKFERPTGPIDFPQNDEEFAIKKHESNIEAPLSPVYINLRNLPEEVLEQYGIVITEMTDSVRSDVCAGIPKAGTPLAKAYSEKSGTPLVDIFAKEEGKDGIRRIVAGNADMIHGRKLRIVDDLATGGDTKIEAAKAAEEMGYDVLDITVLVDRQQGASEQLKEAGYTLRAAFTIDQLLRFGVRTDRISQEKFDLIKTYLGI